MNFPIRTAFPKWLFFTLAFIALLNCSRLLKAGFKPDNPSDFRTVFVGAKLLAHEENPYSDQKVKASWHEIVKTEKLVSDTPPGFPETPLVYPPWALVLFMPFSLLFYKAAYGLWYAIIPVLLFGILRQVKLLCQRYFKQDIPVTDLLLTALAFKSTIPAFLVGQPLFLCLFLGFSALGYADRYKVLSGILLGLAAFKITLALPFLLVFALRRDWKVLALAALTGSILLGTALLLAPDGWEMIESYRVTIAELYQKAFAVSGTELPYFMPLLTELGTVLVYLNPAMFPYLNLFYLLLACLTAWIVFQKYGIAGLPEGWLFLLCALLALLCSYHLLYDCLLLLPLAGFLKGQDKKLLLLTALACSVLFFPVNRLLEILQLPPAFNVLYFTTPLSLLVFLLLILLAGPGKPVKQ